MRIERNDVLVSCDGCVLMNNEDVPDVTTGKSPAPLSAELFCLVIAPERDAYVLQTTGMLSYSLKVSSVTMNTFSYDCTRNSRKASFKNARQKSTNNIGWIRAEGIKNNPSKSRNIKFSSLPWPITESRIYLTIFRRKSFPSNCKQLEKASTIVTFVPIYSGTKLASAAWCS